MHIAVIPAYNEERTIGSVVLQSGKHVDEVIVVDDGSTDVTAEIAELAGATVVRSDRNMGKGRAIRTGLETAAETGGSIVVLLDADGQHNPDEIPKLIEAIEHDGTEFVVGIRSHEGVGRSSLNRRIGRSLLDGLTNFIGGTTVEDTQSGYRAIRMDQLEGLLPDGSGIGVESEMLLAASRDGIRIEEIDIEEHYPDEATPSQSSIQHGISVLHSILHIVRREHPLAFFGLSATMLLILGFIFGYDTTTHYYATREFWPGKAMLSMLFAIIGAQLAIAAILLDYFNTWLEGNSS